MVEQAKAGCSLPADEALVSLAAVIDGLDMSSDTYEADVVALIGVGSTVCTLSGLGGEKVGRSSRQRFPPENASQAGAETCKSYAFKSR